MKKLILIGAFALVSAQAMAGGLSDPIVVPDVVAVEAVEAAGSDVWVMAMLAFLVFAVIGVGGG